MYYVNRALLKAHIPTFWELRALGFQLPLHPRVHDMSEAEMDQQLHRRTAAVIRRNMLEAARLVEPIHRASRTKLGQVIKESEWKSPLDTDSGELYE